MDTCPTCDQPIPPDSDGCPNCSRGLISRERSVVAGGDITGIVITGDIGELHLALPSLPEIPAPEPNRPPETVGFAGRENELAYFKEKLDTNHLAVISGMAGVGKTALAARLARQAAPLDRIFWHAFHPGEGIEVVIWKLAGFLARNGQNELWRMLQGARQTGGRPPPPETLFDYLLEMMRGKGYLLCFDDFQFVDQDPLLNQLITRLRSALLAGELAIIITARRMPEFVQTVEFDALSGLSLMDVKQLLGARGLALSDDQAAEIHRQTAGNAQFLNLAINALLQGEDWERLMAGMAATQDIERYLIREVDGFLPEAERGVMEAVAVLMGYPGTTDAIEAVLDGANVRRTLRDLCDRFLLIASEGEMGREYGQHAIIQAFYYDLIGHRMRRELHSRAGAFYEKEETDLLRAGLHFERAGKHGKAAQLVTSNTWDLINKGQMRALQHLLERFTASKLDSRQWVQVKIGLGQVYNLVGERQSARAGYQEAISILGSLPDSREVRGLTAQVCLGLGELLEQEAPQEALEWLQRGLDVVERGDESLLEEAALHIRTGVVLMNTGNYADAFNALDEGLRQLPGHSLQLKVSALKNMGVIYFLQGEVERAKEYTLQALEISERLNDHFHTVDLLSNLGAYKFSTSDWPGAIADWEQANQLAGRLGSELIRVSPEGNLGTAYIYTGDYKKALTHLQNALELARKNNLQLFESTILFRIAEFRIRLGEWGGAIDYLTEAEEIAKGIEAKGALPEIYSAWTEIKLAEGNPREALEYASQAVDLARELGEGLEQGISLRLLGQAILASGEYQNAMQAFQESLSLLADLDAIEAARTKMQWGMALVSSPEAEAGARLLEAARLTFQELGSNYDLGKLNEFKYR